MSNLRASIVAFSVFFKERRETMKYEQNSNKVVNSNKIVFD
ncbi:hypothetical protein [Candidatus Mycoplasma mahonii]|nr:hypothetical protein [Candidatus Mycoplasma mahonii]WKX02159.1 hypothetical protein O3I44_02025 [Candidatus Mycoplasma mahonii]